MKLELPTNGGVNPNGLRRAAFIRAERDVFQSFVNRNLAENATYSRTYRCDCGFKTADPGVIYDHTCESNKK